MIIAKEFTEQNKKQLLDMINEINEYDADFEGLEHVGKMEDYSAFLKELEKWKYQEQIPPNYSPQTTFGVFDNEKLIGGFVLRHTLKGKVIITCRNDNIGSTKVIESNGGKYENVYYDESLKKNYKRYWIKCE